MGKARWVFPKISNSIQTGRFINYEMIYYFRIHWNWKVTNLQTNVAESQANVEKEMEELSEVVTKQKARMWLNFVFFRFVEMKSFQYLKKGLLCHCYTNSFIPLLTSRCPCFSCKLSSSLSLSLSSSLSFSLSSSLSLSLSSSLIRMKVMQGYWSWKRTTKARWRP